jgi:DNA-binding NarL/FixJ family response regulator
MFYYNFRMADPRKKKSSRKGPQQTNRYFHVLVSPLRLVNRTNPASQENQPAKTPPGNALPGGRRSTDKASFELYNRWLSLSPREQDVTILVCKGFTNEQIALWLKLSVSTVKSYLKHVFFKVGVRNKTELRLEFHNFDFKRNTPPHA